MKEYFIKIEIIQFSLFGWSLQSIIPLIIERSLRILKLIPQLLLPYIHNFWNCFVYRWA